MSGRWRVVYSAGGTLCGVGEFRAFKRPDLICLLSFGCTIPDHSIAHTTLCFKLGRTQWGKVEESPLLGSPIQNFPASFKTQVTLLNQSLTVSFARLHPDTLALFLLLQVCQIFPQGATHRF